MRYASPVAVAAVLLAPALAQASNRELIDAIAGWSSAAAAAEARKFAALAEWQGRFGRSRVSAIGRCPRTPASLGA